MKAADGLYWYACSLSNIFMAKLFYEAGAFGCIEDAERIGGEVE